MMKETIQRMMKKKIEMISVRKDVRDLGIGQGIGRIKERITQDMGE